MKFVYHYKLFARDTSRGTETHCSGVILVNFKVVDVDTYTQLCDMLADRHATLPKPFSVDSLNLIHEGK